MRKNFFKNRSRKILILAAMCSSLYLSPNQAWAANYDIGGGNNDYANLEALRQSPLHGTITTL